MPSPAVAPPPGNPRFALVDSVRGIAVLAVLLYHVTAITGAMNGGGVGDVYAMLGTQGVVIFFVVSGFLLYRPYVAAHAGQRPRPATVSYLRRRALRILPGYWTALIVLALAFGIVGVFSASWWRYFFFLQNYSERTLDDGIPPAWTLAVEVSFYALLPAWAAVLRRVGARVGAARWLRVEWIMLAGLAAFGLSMQLLAAHHTISGLLASTLLGECVWFALGMGLAVLSVEDQYRRSRAVVSLARHRPDACWAGSLAALIGLAALLHPGGVVGVIRLLGGQQPYGRELASLILTGAVATLLVAPAVLDDSRRGVAGRVLAWRWLARLGLISYGFYLYHLTVAEILGESADPSRFSASGLGLVGKLQPVSTLALLALTFAVTTIVATVSYRFLELPFLRLKERRPRVTSDQHHSDA